MNIRPRGSHDPLFKKPIEEGRQKKNRKKDKKKQNKKNIIQCINSCIPVNLMQCKKSKLYI